MNSNDLNEIINECRQKSIIIHFDAWGMTIEKTGGGCSSKKCRILAEAFEDGNVVVSLSFLTDERYWPGVGIAENDHKEGSGKADARKDTGRSPGGTRQAET